MKKIILSFLLFTFISCIKTYDLDQRYTISTQLLDTSNKPIPNVEVDVYFGSNFNEIIPSPHYLSYHKFLFFGDDSDLISTATSDENGIINLTFPAQSSSFSNLSFVVADEDEFFLDLTIGDIGAEDFNANLLEIPALQLAKRNELVNLEIIDAIETPGYFLESYQLYASIIYAALPFENLTTPPNFNQPAIFSVLKNQQVNISVKILNTNENPPISIEFTDEFNTGDDLIQYAIQLP